MISGKDFRGILVWVLILGAAGLLVRSMGDATDPLGKWLLAYQTLVAALVALGGAALAYFAVHDQIARDDERTRDHQDREDFASRPVLAAALSALSGYADGCIRVLLDLVTQGGERVEHPTSELPDVPDDLIATIRDCMLWAGDPTRERLADMLLALQVQNARLRAFRDPPRADHLVLKQNVYEQIGDAADIYARASALFAYARREESDYSADYVHALGLLRFGVSTGDDERIDQALDLQARAFERGTDEARAAMRPQSSWQRVLVIGAGILVAAVVITSALLFWAPLLGRLVSHEPRSSTALSTTYGYDIYGYGEYSSTYTPSVDELKAASPIEERDSVDAISDAL